MVAGDQDPAARGDLGHPQVVVQPPVGELIPQVDRVDTLLTEPLQQLGRVVIVEEEGHAARNSRALGSDCSNSTASRTASPSTRYHWATSSTGSPAATML